jgi:cytidylate kinase
MTIVAISKGSLIKGTDVANKVAQKLGYECLDRQILIEASEQFSIPEVKLNRALTDAPRFIDRLTFGKDKYISYIRNALLDRLAHDNIVYHGIAGQYFLEDVAHVLKVRIVSTMENRVKDVMVRDNIDEKAAAQAIAKIDMAREKWSLHFYGIHIEDARLYDLVININKFTVEEAVELIAATSQSSRFQTTTDSKKQFEDLLLASKAQTVIMKSFPKAVVISRDGVVSVTQEGALGKEPIYDAQIKDALKDIEGIQKVVTKIWPIVDVH